MDQRFLFLRPKEVWPKFIGKKKKGKETNKKHQKTIFDVKAHSITHHRRCLVVSPTFSFSQAYCVFYFLGGGQCCWPSSHLFCQWVQQCLQAILHPPYHQAGESHPGGLGEKGHHLWLLCGWCWGCCLGQSVQEPPCAIQKTNQRFFLLIWETQNFFNQLDAS